MQVIHGIYSYDQIAGDWDTRNHNSRCPRHQQNTDCWCPGHRWNEKGQYRDTAEMQNAGVPDTGNRNTFTEGKIAMSGTTSEMQNACVRDIENREFLTIFWLFTGFFKLQTIATAFKATVYPKIGKIYYFLYKYILFIFLKNV